MDSAKTLAGEARRPDWLKVRLPAGGGYAATRGIVKEQKLHTVCESARCPNIGECWAAGTATVMILGDVCTRACGFCAVKTGRPLPLDPGEPERVAEAIAAMGLSHVVLTSVDRDELPDGGAAAWARTIEAVRRRNPATRIEVLVPDFKGDQAALDLVLGAHPHVLAHNVETVPRLHSEVRPQARYTRSLGVLAHAKSRDAVTKSGLMLGLGEEEEEVVAVLRDLRAAACDILTLGQYLRPTRDHLPVRRFVHPDVFARLAEIARGLGFKGVESGPLVRSSYHAERAAGIFENTNKFSVDGPNDCSVHSAGHRQAPEGRSPGSPPAADGTPR